MSIDQGPVTVVTGAASGIGAACAERLSRQGHRVVGVDRDGSALAAAPVVEALPLDITDAPAVAAGFAEVAHRLGGIDSLVHCAGVMADGTATATEVDQFERVLKVNLTGAFVVIREAVNLMADGGGGTIVALGSTAGVSPPRRYCAYAVAKAGLHMLVRSVAVDYGRRGIRINAVAPGPTQTPMFTADLRRFADPDAELRSILDATLDGALATTDNVVDTVSFLLSAQSSHMHGQVVVLDGGMLHGRS
jgi:NAD(P)-dependent dehydrogenase (short-subunit alcohol dehydrogenase family)